VCKEAKGNLDSLHKTCREMTARQIITLISHMIKWKTQEDTRGRMRLELIDYGGREYRIAQTTKNP